MKVKKLVFLFVFSLTCLCSYAQDVIITIDNKFLEVEIVSSDSMLTFYKVKDDSEIKVMNNKDILSIQLGSENFNNVSNKGKVKSGKNSSRVYVKKKNSLSKGAGIVSALFGFFMLREFSVSQNGSDANEMRATLFFVCSVTAGIIALSNKGKAEYVIAKNQGLGFVPFPKEQLKAIKKQCGTNAYLSTAGHGYGIQYNF